jgi:hypothetical protein
MKFCAPMIMTYINNTENARDVFLDQKLGAQQWQKK